MGKPPLATTYLEYPADLVYIIKKVSNALALGEFIVSERETIATQVAKASAGLENWVFG